MVFQSFQDDCGKACVRNLLAELFRDDVFLSQPLMHACDSFFSIREELLRFDVKYTSYDVTHLFQVKKEQLPAIAQVINGKMTHFVVITRFNKRKVTILDPQFGEYDLSIEEFNEVFLHKMLLRARIGEKPDSIKTKILKPSERVSYDLCFLFEAMASACLILSSGVEDAFPLMVSSLVVFLILILLQNVMNVTIRSRLDREIVLPYMNLTKHRENFLPLNTICNEEIKRYSKSVSYALALVMVAVLLMMNSYYLAFLALFSFLVNLLRIPLFKEKNKVNRYCTIKENEYLDDITYSREESYQNYKQAKTKSRNFLLKVIFSYLLEFMIELVFIFFALEMAKRMNINLVVYYLGLTMTFSFLCHQLYDSFLNRREELVSFNRLSYPLSVFLLKNTMDLKYNIIHKGEVEADESKTYPRVPQSGRQGEGSEEDLHLRL